MLCYFRDLLVVQQELMRDARLDGCMLSQFEMRVNKKGHREFDELNTGLLWEGWQHDAEQRFPGKALSIAPGIGYSDATVAQKSQSCYTVYSTYPPSPPPPLDVTHSTDPMMMSASDSWLLP